MTVSSVSAATTSASSAIDNSRATIADNFDTFLSILTTQLKNQNPLDPLDTNEFTNQLVQFTSVEQQLQTNEFLESLLALSQSANIGDAVSYIGKTVTAEGAQAQMQDGRAVWTYALDTNADDVTVTIRDEAGNTVYTEQGALAAGDGTFIWDGTGTDGKTYSSGAYQITIDARSASGSYVAVSTQVAGVVDAVDLSDGTPVLIIGDSRVDLSSVTSVIG